jgi:formate hydrogenlyase subunit 3/multisubunit Na+/H+ antiporter MnhD subunit
MDKIYHLIAGIALALVTLIATGSVFAAMIATTVVGLGKEIYDYQHQDKHTPEVADFLATVVGGLLVCLVYLLSWQWLFGLFQ